MSPADFPKLVAVLLAVSIGIEVSLLAGVFHLDTAPYHLMHVALMGALVLGQFALWQHARAARRPEAGAALALAIGAACTAVGDFVNGAVSGIEPVSLKLTWALLLFGTGYTLYVITLWRHAAPALHESAPRLYAWRYAIALVILAGNLLAWFQHVEARVAGHDLLYYGSFVFNATLYVMLPTCALWLAAANRFSLGSIVVLIGAILVPYSDLVLFDSWLRGGDPAVPSFELYAYNWIVYFGGQALFATFPSLLMNEGLSPEAR